MSMNFKRHYPILILVTVVLSLLAFVLGKQRVIAYTTENDESEQSLPTSGYDVSNSIDIFDDSTIHSVQVIMSEGDYDQMLSTYQETGLKDYFHADVIIDGVRVNNVGIRLKGNASLRSALGGNMNPGGMRQGDFVGGRPDLGEFPQMPEAGQRPDLGERPQPPQDLQPPAADQENDDNGQLQLNWMNKLVINRVFFLRLEMVDSQT